MIFESTVTYRCSGCGFDVTMNTSYDASWMFSCQCGEPLMGKMVSEFTVEMPLVNALVAYDALVGPSRA